MLGCACNFIAYYLCASHDAGKIGIVFSGVWPCVCVCLSVCLSLCRNWKTTEKKLMKLGMNICTGASTPNSHDATLSPPPPLTGPGGITSAQMLAGEFFDIKIKPLWTRFFWLSVITFEFQVKVHAALWKDEVLYSCFQCFLCSISLLIVADWSLHYIIQNFKRFFLPWNFSDAACVISTLGWTPLYMWMVNRGSDETLVTFDLDLSPWELNLMVCAPRDMVGPYPWDTICMTLILYRVDSSLEK